MNLSDLNAYLQLIQEIIGGTVRRHKFTPTELDLLLDVQASQVRKTAKNELLRRYFRAVQQQFADGSLPPRFSAFWQAEVRGDGIQAEGAAPLVRVRTATPA